MTLEKHQTVLTLLDTTKLECGPILRGVSRYSNVGRKLDAGSMERICMKLATRAVLGKKIVSGISGHSAEILVQYIEMRPVQRLTNFRRSSVSKILF